MGLLCLRCGACRFRQILKKIVDTKQGMGKSMRESAFALTEAKYAAGETSRQTVFDSVETVCPAPQSSCNPTASSRCTAGTRARACDLFLPAGGPSRLCHLSAWTCTGNSIAAQQIDWAFLGHSDDISSNSLGLELRWQLEPAARRQRYYSHVCSLCWRRPRCG